MVKLHPNINDDNFLYNIGKEIEEFKPTGFVCMDTLKVLYNLFSWVYIEDSISEAFIKKGTKLEEFLGKYDLYLYKGSSLSYSAVLFYERLSKAIDIRKFSSGEICSYSEGDNKVLTSDDFTFENLYNVYKDSKYDIDRSMLAFNTIFNRDNVRASKGMEFYSDVIRVISKTDLIRPDMPYRFANKDFRVHKDVDMPSEQPNKLFVIQDCTHSMSNFVEPLTMLKAFILNEALANNTEVIWLSVSSIVRGRSYYTKENIKDAVISFKFRDYTVNLTNILRSDELVNEKVIVITDGTDSFDFKLEPRTKDINVISFSNNIKIKNKICNYGRFFYLRT